MNGLTTEIVKWPSRLEMLGLMYGAFAIYATIVIVGISVAAGVLG